MAPTGSSSCRATAVGRQARPSARTETTRVEAEGGGGARMTSAEEGVPLPPPTISSANGRSSVSMELCSINQPCSINYYSSTPCSVKVPYARGSGGGAQRRGLGLRACPAPSEAQEWRIGRRSMERRRSANGRLRPRPIRVISGSRRLKLSVRPPPHRLI